MYVIGLGCLGFICYFLYDYNSVKKIAGWMRALFMAGTLFLAAATCILFWKNKAVLFQTSSDCIWMAGSVFFLCLLSTHSFLLCLLKQPMWKNVNTGKLTRKGSMLCVGIPVFYGLGDFICVRQHCGKARRGLCFP